MNNPFFEPGITYVNDAPYARPAAHPQVILRFQCLAVARHPNNSELHAVGWVEIFPGAWCPGSVGAEHLIPDHWTEEPCTTRSS